MAQWSRTDRTLYAKLVYYGPAYGGKTTNLESIHRITDPGGTQRLLSLKTSDDRTLFFDLLPFDLGSILGYHVAIKLYTVPGQVRYDSTRRVVLAGADAVVFVADSTPGREPENRDSLQNLRANMQANRLDPATVPVLFQCNKQDVEGALPPEAMAEMLGIAPASPEPAVAVDGLGVMETFTAASRAMMQRLVALADTRTRGVLDPEQLERHLSRAFAPYLERVRAAGSLPRLPEDRPRSESAAIVPSDDGGVLRQSIESGLRLGEQLTAERSRAARLEREAQALRQLSEALRRTAASFDRGDIVRRALDVVSEVVGAPVVALLRLDEDGAPDVEAVRGAPDDPLVGDAAGRGLLRRMLRCVGPCVADDLAADVAPERLGEEASRLRAALAVPLDAARRSSLVAYAPRPDGRFSEEDVRFVATVAAHLAVGLEKSGLHARLEKRSESLAEQVAVRTEELRRAYDDLRALERMKDRFLSSVSHEMRTPLTTIVSAASFLRDYPSEEAARREMGDAILGACGALEHHLDQLFRAVGLGDVDARLRVSETTPQGLAAEALALAPDVEADVRVDPRVDALVVDVPRMARALADLLDNARKFSPAGSPVELGVEPATLGDGAAPDAVAVRVLDRGPGVPPGEIARLMQPFEQGRDGRGGKPPGIGLGLYEARTIARAHGGVLEYRPRESGGSEFRIVVPRVVAGAGVAAEVARV